MKLLRLVLSEKDGSNSEARLLPSRRFTVGRRGDVVPIIGKEWISSIHCTVEPFGDGWQVSDGDGETASRNGIFKNNIRVSSAILREPEDAIDLLPYSENLILRIVLTENVSGLVTGDFTKVSAEQLKGEMDEFRDEVRSWQEKQESRTSHIEELVMSMHEDLKAIKKNDARQDSLMQRGRNVVLGLIVVAMLLLVCALADEKERQEYIQNAVKVMAIGLTTTAAITIKGGKKDEGDD